jgi:hypothetical protein
MPERNLHKIEMHTPDPGYEPFPVSFMNRSTHEVFSFDPSKGETAKVRYGLNKAGWVRIRLVLRDHMNMVVKTLQDWTRQEFGKYELVWDGRDNSGHIVDNKKIFVVFEAKDQGKGLRHQVHDARDCREPVLEIASPPESARGTGGTLTIHGKITTGTRNGEKAGYSVAYTIDYREAGKICLEAGTAEFQVTVDTGSLGKGEHLIQFNVDDTEDHVGSASALIQVS